MEKLDQKINAWLRDHLVPQLAGIFCEICSPNEVEYKVTRPRGSFFMSNLFFVSIKFPGQERCVLVKLPSQNTIVSTFNNYDSFFANEILFYQRLAPRGSSDYSKTYLCGKDPVFGNVMVLENVCLRGYTTCPLKINADMDYTVAALQSIARFHGNVYAIKEQTPVKFYEIMKSVTKTRYREGSEHELYPQSLNIRLKRVTKHLRVRNYDQDFADQMEYLFDDCFTNVMMKAIKPKEPLALIVHGDCTINNVLFRKSTNGDIKAMLIDFAMIMYSSPAIDVSNFIYMSCSRKVIKDRTEELLKVYYDCLRDYMKDRGVWDPSKYTYEALRNEYRRSAIFGYAIGAYFLPMMTEFSMDNDVLEYGLEKMEELNITGGGEALSNLLVDMLIDMREAGLLDCYVNNHNAADKL